LRLWLRRDPLEVFLHEHEAAFVLAAGQVSRLADVRALVRVTPGLPSELAGTRPQLAFVLFSANELFGVSESAPLELVP
jgi:hypothetical protein